MAGDFDDIELTVTQEGPLSPQGIIDQWIASHQAEAGTSAASKACHSILLPYQMSAVWHAHCYCLSSDAPYCEQILARAMVNRHCYINAAAVGAVNSNGVH
eukprot:16676-Heterococcus_DN1.PRE.3